MSESKKTKPEAQGAAVNANGAASAEKASFPVSLEEFCTFQSQSDRRVEMLGAFARVERGAGRVRDAQDAYAARYAEFINQPA